MTCAPVTANFEGQREARRSNFRQSFQPAEELHKRPVGRAEQVAIAVPAFLHRGAKSLRRVAHVDKTQAAVRHGADLARHEIENDFG